MKKEEKIKHLKKQYAIAARMMAVVNAYAGVFLQLAEEMKKIAIEAQKLDK